jgi:hypothetical protein
VTSQGLVQKQFPVFGASALTPPVRTKPLRRGEGPALSHRYLFTVLPTPVAQTCTLSVSIPIVAGRDDLVERGSVSRSTLIATHALDLSKRWTAGKAPAGHRPALLWLRPRRAGLYRRVALCQTSGNHGAWDRSDALPITNRRYSRLKICATVNRYSSSVGRRIHRFGSCERRIWLFPLPSDGRVRVRVLLFEIRLLTCTCFCTNPKMSKGAR